AAKARSQVEMEAAFEALSQQRADAIIFLPDPNFLSRRNQIVTLVAGLDGGVEPVLLLVELGAQEIRHKQPKPTDAPLALHGDRDLVETLEHGLDSICRRRERLGLGV